MGMKTGAGEDPFADEQADDRGDDGDGGGDQQRAERSGSAGAVREQRGGDRRTGGRDPDRTTAEAGESSTGGQVQAPDLPFIARRNARGDNIKAGREKRRLFELRPAIAEKEEAFLTELSRELGVDVAKTDAREAALAVVYERPELVAERLEEWGINYFD